MPNIVQPEAREFHKTFNGPGYGFFVLKFTMISSPNHNTPWMLPTLRIIAWDKSSVDSQELFPSGNAMMEVRRHSFSRTRDLRAWLARYTEARLREDLDKAYVDADDHPGRAFDRALLELDDWIVAWVNERGLRLSH